MTHVLQHLIAEIQVQNVFFHSNLKARFTMAVDLIFMMLQSYGVPPRLIQKESTSVEKEIMDIVPAVVQFIQI